MKRYLFVLPALLFFLSAFAQDYSDPQNMEVTYTREAYYQGGDMQLVQDIWSKMEYTEEAVNALVDSQIMVSFNVNTDSTVSGISIIRGLDYGINEEFVRVFKQLKFVPAIADGNIVTQNMILNIPIRAGPGSKRKQTD